MLVVHCIELPWHTFSHVFGVLLSVVLEFVDAGAKEVALQQDPAIGWIKLFQKP